MRRPSDRLLRREEAGARAPPAPAPWHPSPSSLDAVHLKIGTSVVMSDSAVAPVAAAPEAVAAAAPPAPQTESLLAPDVMERSQHPGSFDTLGREVREVLASSFFFDGFKVEIAKGMTPNLQVMHRLRLGSQTAPQSYSLGSMLVPNERLFLMGDFDTGSKAFNGRVHYSLNPAITAKATFQTSKDGSAHSLEADYMGKDSSGAVRVYQPNPLDMTGIVVYNYLQKVTPSLALGMEGTAMMTGPRVDSSMTLVARHAAGNHVGIATLSAAKSQFSYFQQVTPLVQAGSELELSVAEKAAVCTFGIRVNLQANTIRAQLDTAGRLGVHFEERVIPNVFNIHLAGQLDYVKNTSQFGFGLSLGGM
ncbi:hypothetical protein H696_01093 [Fonticula alba]|uniref:Mitochondrial import receptor subunit TOM40 n=1 Tax=Fonticula alba TaxID=691883 RepID=A0A058ZCK9_FONAL|nr:hypothetical protein H696_01093 [Fonticula alba]KCV71676.1 hypothetical protein H696_01093 [Fonticula alba]|eukprot:XP_009493254.1 hypothetical protein H696_01093 [Fonticula alba]